MPVDISYWAAFMVGLLGGVHCVGMCGGIVAALSFGLAPGERDSRTRLPLLLAYNLARIFSYSLAGALLGGLGYMAAHWSGLHQLQVILQYFASLMMIALGLYLAGWWMGVGRLEQIGAHVWRRLEPLGRQLLPVRNPVQAFALGMVWGWLPCGLVYSVLIWAISMGSALQGALLLFCFGLGTLPALLAMGMMAARLNAFTRHPWVRRSAGLLVIGFGLVGLWRMAGA